MFAIIVTACIVGGDICAQRMLPTEMTDAATCAAETPARTSEWLETHQGLAIRSIACIPQAELARHVPPLDITEVAPGVFVHKPEHGVPTPQNAGDLANLGFVVGKNSVAVIDAGGSRQVAERLYSAIRVHTNLPVSTLILTHMHPDHSLGASLFQEAGATIIGHPNLPVALANRAENYRTAMQRLMGAQAFLGTRIVGPDDTETQSVDLGGQTLTIEYVDVTAHTETDVIVVDEATGTLFTGDLVFAGHAPALDGSILGWQRVLDNLAGREFVRIVPGHGPAALDWPGGADAVRAYLAVITSETREAIAKGEPMSRAVRHIGESQRSQWEFFDEFNQRNATAAYKELEWE